MAHAEINKYHIINFLAYANTRLDLSPEIKESEMFAKITLLSFESKFTSKQKFKFINLINIKSKKDYISQN